MLRSVVMYTTLPSFLLASENGKPPTFTHVQDCILGSGDRMEKRALWQTLSPDLGPVEPPKQESGEQPRAGQLAGWQHRQPGQEPVYFPHPTRVAHNRLLWLCREVGCVRGCARQRHGGGL